MNPLQFSAGRYWKWLIQQIRKRWWRIFPSGTRKFFSCTICSTFLTDPSYRISIRNVGRYSWNIVMIAKVWPTPQKKKRPSIAERDRVFAYTDIETAIILVVKPKTNKNILTGELRLCNTHILVANAVFHSLGSPGFQIGSMLDFRL